MLMRPAPTAPHAKNRCIFLQPPVPARATNDVTPNIPGIPAIIPGAVPGSRVAAPAEADDGSTANTIWNVPENVPEKPQPVVVTEVRKGLVSERANAYIAMAAGGVAAATAANGGSWRTIV